MTPFSSVRIGYVHPNRAILAPIWSSCFFEWTRAFLLFGRSLRMGTIVILRLCIICNLGRAEVAFCEKAEDRSIFWNVTENLDSVTNFAQEAAWPGVVG
jgi:hypothetical protein